MQQVVTPFGKFWASRQPSVPDFLRVNDPDGARLSEALIKYEWDNLPPEERKQWYMHTCSDGSIVRLNDDGGYNMMDLPSVIGRLEDWAENKTQAVIRGEDVKHLIAFAKAVRHMVMGFDEGKP